MKICIKSRLSNAACDVTILPRWRHTLDIHYSHVITCSNSSSELSNDGSASALVRGTVLPIVRRPLCVRGPIRETPPAKVLEKIQQKDLVYAQHQAPYQTRTDLLRDQLLVHLRRGEIQIAEQRFAKVHVQICVIRWSSQCSNRFLLEHTDSRHPVRLSLNWERLRAGKLWKLRVSMIATKIMPWCR